MKKLKIGLAAILVAMFCVGFLMIPVGAITFIWFNIILGDKIFFTGSILVLFSLLIIRISHDWIVGDEDKLEK